MCEACPQTLLDKFGRLCGPQWESRDLEGKVIFLFHFPLGPDTDNMRKYSCYYWVLCVSQHIQQRMYKTKGGKYLK